MTERILVISAHPDDETIGCGGTMLKHIAKGDEVSWLVATAPVGPRWSKESLAQEKETLQRVVQAFRIHHLYELDFPSTELGDLPRNQLIDAIRNVVTEVKPQIIYAIHRGDIHSDHRVLFDAFSVVVKPFNDYGIVRILAYECLSSTDAAPPFIERVFVPNVYSDISEYLERKLSIMRLYETEVQPEPLPRSESAMRALARFRGSTIGVEYAEAFMLVRELI